MFTRSFVADDLTPVRAYAALRAAHPEEASFLFESVVGGERWARYSILGFAPRYEARLLRDGWHLDGDAPPLAECLQDATDPFAAAAPLFAPKPDDAPAHLAEHLARALVGYVAWDVVHVIEKVPPGSDETWGRHFVPLARFLGDCTIVVFDALTQLVTVASRTKDDLERAIASLERAPHLRTIAVPDRRRLPAVVDVDMTDDEYRAAVLRAKEYIAAGDAFQIVLARTFSTDLGKRDPFDVYRALRLINPSPYMYFLDLPPAPGETDRFRIAGASPETMVRVEDRRMTVRPIAGTRPRGATEIEDARMERELLADEKERAEHVMLIDLGRNDVGRVAETGTVRLVKNMAIERYSHVMHMVSEVEGTVPAKLPPLEVVRAAFPAGTLSGAPKVRAMQIIRELEARPRNLYGGAVGYSAKTGNLDFAIAIRTAIFRGNRVEVTAGAGIVEASDPASEAEETRNKARGVLSAIASAPEVD